MDVKVHPRFDVATIRPTKPDDQSAGFHTIGERIWIENETMSAILAFAYGLHKAQIVNAPGWFDTERFDIRGKADLTGQPNLRQQREMVSSLLEERLDLKFHQDERLMSRFVLRAPHGASKLTNSAHSTDNLPDQTGNSEAAKQEWHFTNNSMSDFAHFLQDAVDRPVVDETSLPGTYDFSLKWANEDAPAVSNAGDLPGLLTAIHDQLGLIFKTDHGPTKVLHIDSVIHPTTN